MENYLFINGMQGLERIIYDRHRAIDLQLAALEDEKCDLKIKKINGADYWYLWREGKWNSKGVVEAGFDYKAELGDKVRSLEEDKERIKEEVMAVLVSEIGEGHCIINSKKYLCDCQEAIPLSEVYPFFIPGSGAITDKLEKSEKPQNG